uniref:Uncharacterized protein n=1 Tax=uncultured Chloroflexota bacterium TaxID=166587 RepID=H5SCW9_9CHLR|nr:hypothetical protein HGMM_F11H08C15 [uncultured Chloroflexota bacterium]
MKPFYVLYGVAVLLFLIAACAVGLGGFLYLASLDPRQGEPAWATMGGTLACGGALAFLAALGALVFAIRRQQQERVQVTYQVELPGEVEAQALKCQACGGALTANDVKMVNGAPVVTCPYCGMVYQLREEPKW